MPSTITTEKPGSDASLGTGLGDMSQVVLFNDNHNTVDHVVACLMRTFGHSGALATKIMLEAHNRGRAIAEVEETAKAQEHCAQLLQAGLGATVETV